MFHMIRRLKISVISAAVSFGMAVILAAPGQAATVPAGLMGRMVGGCAGAHFINTLDGSFSMPCPAGGLFQIPLPVVNFNSKTVILTVRSSPQVPEDTECKAVAVSATGTVTQTALVTPTGNSVLQDLTFAAISVPSGGYFFVHCFLEGGAEVSRVSYSQ